MRRILAGAMLALLLALGTPAAMWGQTFLRDDTGAVAPPVVFRGTGGAQTQAQSTDPLPVTGASAAPTTSTTDATGWGRRLFSSGQNITNGLGAGIVWQDDQTLIGVGAPGLFGAGTVGVFRSSDRGVTWGVVAVASITPSLPGSVSGLLQIAGTGTYLVTGGASATATMWRGSLPSGPFAEVPGSRTPIDVSRSFGAVQQGGTIIAAGEGLSGFICRSTDQAATMACATHAAITGNISGNHGTQRIASPALSAWLALDDNRGISRSTDDGVTWTAITTLAGVAGQGRALVCVSSTICVAAVRASAGASNVFQSIDAGLTWTQVAVSQSAPIMGFLNYGDGILLGVLDPFTVNTTGMRSADSGATWQPIGPVSPVVGGALPVMLSLVTRNGRAAIAAQGVIGAAGVAGFYTVAVGTGDIGLVGPNGVRLDINSLGHAGSYQGSGAVNSGTLEAWQTTPVQRGTLQNTRTVSAANAAAVATITAVASARAHVYSVEARCSAGAAALSITAGGTTIWDTPAAAVGPNGYARMWPPGLTGATNSAVVITLGACGAGNTGTLIVQGDRF